MNKTSDSSVTQEGIEPTESRQQVRPKNRDEVFTCVREILCAILPNVREDEVILSATLRGDLGAKSIDFLDIAFRLDRVFEIKVPRGGLFVDEQIPDGESADDTYTVKLIVDFVAEKLGL